MAALVPIALNSLSVAAEPSRGLWVGDITLDKVAYVGETETVDGAGTPLPTPTADSASLRVILHVNGAGQVSLLKGVALLRRSDGLEERDVGLITDESLYQNYFPIGRRVASAGFDFGDAGSIELLNAIVTAAGNRAAARAIAGDAEAAAAAEAETAAQPIVDGADVDSSYRDYLQNDFLDAAGVEAIAREVAALVLDEGSTADDFAQPEGAPYDPFPSASPVRLTFNNAFTAARDLRDLSPYGDDRGMEALEAIATRAATAASEAPGGDRAAAEAAAVAAGLNVFHSAADFGSEYALFVASSPFDAALEFAIQQGTQAAVDEKAAGGDAAAIEDSVRASLARADENGVAPVGEARAEALRIELEATFGDPRAGVALEAVLDAIVDALVGSADAGEGLSVVAATAELARQAAVAEIPPAVALSAAPVPEYSEFIQTSAFQNAAGVAAVAAATEAVRLFGDGTTDLGALSNDARAAARRALVTAFGLAAGVSRPVVGLDGTLEVGGTVHGQFMLPANHPTNPFKHFRHSEHTSGYDITRKVQFSFDSASPGEAIARGGFGVDRITGVFAEEIFGLHKPLGPDPVNSPVGIRVQGSFILNRISYVDTLNVP